MGAQHSLDRILIFSVLRLVVGAALIALWLRYRYVLKSRTVGYLLLLPAVWLVSTGDVEFLLLVMEKLHAPIVGLPSAHFDALFERADYAFQTAMLAAYGTWCFGSLSSTLIQHLRRRNTDSEV